MKVEGGGADAARLQEGAADDQIMLHQAKGEKMRVRCSGPARMTNNSWQTSFLINFRDLNMYSFSGKRGAIKELKLFHCTCEMNLLCWCSFSRRQAE